MSVRVQTQDFDAGAEIAALRRANPKVGAVASFIGVVRDVNEGDAVRDMTLEHYPGMTERALEKIVAEAKSRWDIIDVLVVHRVGRLAPTDQIVLVVVTGAHRGEAFAACEFVMDYLEDPRAVLEEGADRRGRTLGRGAQRRRRRRGTLGAVAQNAPQVAHAVAEQARRSQAQGGRQRAAAAAADQFQEVHRHGAGQGRPARCNRGDRLDLRRRAGAGHVLPARLAAGRDHERVLQVARWSRPRPAASTAAAPW